MNSPNIFRLFSVAVVLAAIGFFAANLFATLHATTVAISILLGALIAPLFNNAKNNNELHQDIKTLYVGNLPYRANEAVIRELFSSYGMVHSVRLMKDKNTGKRRGFGFVEMSANDAENAINALNDTEFQQRTLKIREAKDRPDKQVNESDE